MKKSFVSMVIVLASAGGFLTLVGAASALEGDGPTTKQIMAFVNKPGEGQIFQLKKDLASSEPDWTVIKDKTKKIADCVANLPKNDPTKGDKEAWTKAAKKYVAVAKKLDDAAGKKDLEASKKFSGAMLNSCKKCHSEFKK